MYASTALEPDGAPLDQRPFVGSTWRLIGLGFVYWFVIVAALEPGNIVHALDKGSSPRWGHELLRLIGAGLLGSVTVPLCVSLTRRFPVHGAHLWRNAIIHLAWAILAATLMITIAHGLASWLLNTANRITVVGLKNDLAANELLLVTGLAALSGLIHIAPSRLNLMVRSPAPRSGACGKAGDYGVVLQKQDHSIATIETVEIKVRGLTKHISVGEIDWIESQGNYLALHIGDSIFLLRETLTRFGARLDPGRFVRIHRRTIAAIDRMTLVEPSANGDAIVRLRDGQSLRVSRLYRKSLAGRVPA